MEPEPFVIQVADLGWETWEPPELISERGAVQWKTFNDVHYNFDLDGEA